MNFFRTKKVGVQVEDKYEYYWNEEKERFILLFNGEELDEFRTEKILRMYAKNAVKIDKY